MTVNEGYLQIVFESENEEDNLRKIEIIGAPTEQSNSNGHSISETTHNFLETFVAQELFKGNRTLSQYSFESLRLWMYDTQKPVDMQGFPLPNLEQVSFQIQSHLIASELKYISILDVGLFDNPKKLWKTGCEELLKPMFSRFIAPPEPPGILKDFLVMRFGAQLSNKLDLYLSMRQNMHFDALIIEAK
ncbi:MAG: hypothetical protein AAF635_10810 [Cyanobacteria bacterium P01_C01_bin.69]